MKHAPALASRKTSHAQQQQLLVKQQSRERQGMNMDLMQSRNNKNGLMILSKELEQSHQVSYLYNANTEKATSKKETASRIARDISTKLHRNDRSPVASILANPKQANIQSIKIIQTSQSPIKKHHDNQKQPQQKLEHMLTAVIPENPYKTKTTNGHVSPGVRQTVIDQRKTSNVLTSSGNEQSSVYRDDIQSRHQQQQQYEPSTPLMSEIQTRIRNNKKSVQHDAAKVNKLLSVPAPHFNNKQIHQRSQNFRVLSGSGEVPQTLINQECNGGQQQQKSAYTSHPSHSNMVNIQVPLQGQYSTQGSVTKTQYLQPTKHININPTAMQLHQSAVSSSKNHSNHKQHHLHYYHSQNHTGSNSPRQNICQQQTNLPPGTTKLQQQILRNNNIAIMSSAKALNNYQNLSAKTKIQRIQIVNKSNRNNDNSPKEIEQLRTNILMQNQYEAAASYQQQQQQNQHQLHVPSNNLQHNLKGQIGKRATESSFIVDQNRDTINLFSQSQGKQSSPNATSSQISPIDGHISSYLHPQSPQRFDGKPVLKQIQTTPIVTTNMVDASPTNLTQSGASQIVATQSAIINQNSGNKQQVQQRSPRNGKLMKNANTSAFQQHHGSFNSGVHVLQTAKSPQHDQQQNNGVAGSGARGSTLLGASIEKNSSILPGVAMGTSTTHMQHLNNDLMNSSAIVMPIEDRTALEVVSQQIQQKTTNKDVQFMINEKSEQDFLLDSSKFGFNMSPSKRQQQQQQRNANLGITVQHKTSYTNRMKNTLASILEPLMSSEDCLADSEDVQMKMQQNLTSQPKTTRNGIQSMPTRLPKLQFVVKYANRSRHDSTVRHRDIDLQGSRTHIMPLNLLHQNSLYFVEDPDLLKAYAAAAQSASPSTMMKQEFTHKATMNKTSKNQTVRSGFNTEKLVEQLTTQQLLSPQHQNQKEQDMLQMLTVNKSRLQQTQQIKNLHPNEEQLYPHNAQQSSMAWVRKSRRTLGYIRSLKQRPFNIPQTKQQFHSTVRDNQLSPIGKDPISSWDDLQNKFIMEVQNAGMTEADLEGLKLQKQIWSGTTSKVGGPSSEINPAELQKYPEFIDSHGVTNPESSAPPYSGYSRGRNSSAGDYQSYLLQPKILPSTSSNRQQNPPNLALTSTNFDALSSGGGCNNHFIGALLPSSSKDKVGPPNSADGCSFEDVAPIGDTADLQVTFPPRTSQLERRQNRIVQETTFQEIDQAATAAIAANSKATGPCKNDNQAAVEESLKLPQGQLQQGSSTFKQIAVNGNMLGVNLGQLTDNNQQHQTSTALNSPISPASQREDKMSNDMIIGAIVNTPKSGSLNKINQIQNLKNQQMLLQQQSRNSAGIFRIEAPGRRNKSNTRASLMQTMNNGNCFSGLKRLNQNSLYKDSGILQQQQSFQHQNASFDKRNKGNSKSKSKGKSSKKRINQKRAPLAQSDFSKDVDEISCSDDQYSQAVLCNQEQSSSVVQTTDREYFIEKASQSQQIGQFRGLNNLLGLHPSSKQSEMTRTRIQKLIQTGHSPFRPDEIVEDAKSGNTDIGSIISKKKKSKGVGNSYVAAEFRDCIDYSLANNMNGSWQQTILNNELQITQGVGADQLLLSTADRSNLQRLNYKGVQVMRNGDVSPQYSGDLYPNSPKSNKHKGTGKDYNNNYATQLDFTNQHEVVAQKQIKLISKQVTQSLNQDDFSQFLVDDDSQNNLQFISPIVEQKFVVQVQSKKDKQENFGDVASLAKIDDRDDDLNSRTPVNEEGSEEDGDRKTSSEITHNLKDSKQQQTNNQQSSSSHTTPDQPVESPDKANETSQQDNEVDLKMSKNESVEELEDEEEEDEMLDTQINMVQTDLSPMHGQTHVSWRLNNDSVQYMGDEVQSKDSAAQAVSSHLTKSLTSTANHQQRQKARVRPGINNILPKQLMQELVESQGRRQMEHWLGTRKSSYDPTNTQKNRASTSPTREYLMRKFNDSKRKKEVNFFKQAAQEMHQAQAASFQRPSEEMTHGMSPQNGDQAAVLNYENASKNYKLQGVNVLTGTSAHFETDTQNQ